MRILWLCNTMIPMIAQQLGLGSTQKEGWISGLCDTVMGKQKENKITLAIAFPLPEGLDFFQETFEIKGNILICYGFHEDTGRPELYDVGLEEQMRRITEDFNPDVIHCFGAEYPHTYAMCEAYQDKKRLLIGIQGICSRYAEVYFSDLPQKVIETVTLRDFLKNDSIKKQQQKFEARGRIESKAIKLAGNIAGRTQWDREYAKEENPEAQYYVLNETLRPNFYTEEWMEENCEPYSIFISQGDYPIKGLHYMLAALPRILEEYPMTRVYVAGNQIAKYQTWKEKCKISSYGKYLYDFMKRRGLEDKVIFLGMLDAEQIKEQYLKSNLFVCCSSIEISPNSLGEAMLLGMPCISDDVGGIQSIFTGGADGILYKGLHKKHKNNNTCYAKADGEDYLNKNAEMLADAIIEMWSDRKQQKEYCKNARIHAKKTHDKEKNYLDLIEIYSNIISKQGGEGKGHKDGQV